MLGGAIAIGAGAFWYGVSEGYLPIFPSACRGLGQTDCETNPDCHWYKKYIWGGPTCYPNPQNYLMDYAPIAIVVLGVGLMVWGYSQK